MWDMYTMEYYSVIKKNEKEWNNAFYIHMDGPTNRSTLME